MKFHLILRLDFKFPLILSYSQTSAAFPNANLDSASSIWILQGFVALYTLVC